MRRIVCKIFDNKKSFLQPISFVMIPILVGIFLFANVKEISAKFIVPYVNIGGIITDQNNQPISGARIAAIFYETNFECEDMPEDACIDNHPIDKQVFSNSEGIYALNDVWLCGMSFILYVDKEGYLPSQQVLSPNCWTSISIDITLQPEVQAVNPVIIIPGIMGSWNTRALAGMVLGEWEVDPILHVYDQLIANLTEYGGYVQGETLFMFPYDWRNNNVITAAYLKEKINEVKSLTGADKVDIVAHSMGGLVARFYAESELYEQDIDQIIFIATPQLGAPKSYLTWEAGYTGIGWEDKIKEWLMQQIAEVNGYNSVFEYVREKPLGSVKDLLPVYSYLFDQPSNALRIYPDWYPVNERLEFFNKSENLDKLYSSGIEITEIYSDMPNTTIVSYDVVNPTDEQLPLWEHGYVDGFSNWNRSNGINLGEGDLTVPTISSSFLNSDREIVYYDVNHSDIVSRASQDVLDVLTGQYIEINVIDQPDDYIIIQVYSPVDFQVISPSGKRLGKDFASGQAVNEIDKGFYSGFDTPLEFVTIPNPENGAYQIIITGTDQDEYVLKTSYASEGITLTSAESGSITTGQEIIYDLELNISAQEPNLDLQPQDQVPPLIIINSPTDKQYLHSEIVNVDYEVSDDTGISSQNAYLNNATTTDSQFDLFEFSLGEYEFKVEAYDIVNNQTEETVIFEVIATFDSLEADINRLFNEGDIKDKKTTKYLLKQVDKLEKWYNKINKSKNKHKNKDEDRGDYGDEDWDEPEFKVKDKWLAKLVDKHLDKLEKKDKISQKANNMITEQITYIINHL